MTGTETATSMSWSNNDPAVACRQPRTRGAANSEIAAACFSTGSRARAFTASLTRGSSISVRGTESDSLSVGDMR